MSCDVYVASLGLGRVICGTAEFVHSTLSLTISITPFFGLFSFDHGFYFVDAACYGP